MFQNFLLAERQLLSLTQRPEKWENYQKNYEYCSFCLGLPGKDGFFHSAQTKCLLADDYCCDNVLASISLAGLICGAI